MKRTALIAFAVLTTGISLSTGAFAQFGGGWIGIGIGGGSGIGLGGPNFGLGGPAFGGGIGGGMGGGAVFGGAPFASGFPFPGLDPWGSGGGLGPQTSFPYYYPGNPWDMMWVGQQNIKGIDMPSTMAAIFQPTQTVTDNYGRTIVTGADPRSQQDALLVAGSQPQTVTAFLQPNWPDQNFTFNNDNSNHWNMPVYAPRHNYFQGGGNPVPPVPVRTPINAAPGGGVFDPFNPPVVNPFIPPVVNPIPNPNPNPFPNPVIPPVPNPVVNPINAAPFNGVFDPF